MPIRWQVTSNQSNRAGNKWAATIFGAIFCAIPLVMIVFLLTAAVRQVETRFWPRVSCAIVESRVEETPTSVESAATFEFKARYTYEFGGAKFASETYRRGGGPTKDEGAARRAARRYPAGAKASCLVNPSSPETTVLEHAGVGSVLIAFVIMLIPMLFIAIGAGIIVSAWRSGRPAPLSSKSKREKTWMLFVFFGVFLLAGLGVLGGVFVPMLVRVQRAKSWVETPCEILESRVLTSHGDKGSTYRVGVLYRYAVADREYRSNRYDFGSGSSSGYDGKKEKVDRLSAGTTTVCYVNPSSPREAVLLRDAPAMMFVALIPLVFAIIGAAGLWWSLRRRGKARALLEGWRTAARQPRILTSAEGSPALRPLMMLLLALFWNGIVSVFLFEVVKQWRAGQSPWGLTLFLMPFVLIGLGIVGAVVYYLLASFNPRIHVTATPGEVRLGERVELAWEFSGRADRISRLRLSVEGREEATIGTGKQSRIAKETFFKADLVDLADAMSILSGRAHFEVPADTMHTFVADSIKITWRVVVRGEIARWPDVKEELAFTVRPMSEAGGGTAYA